jgi:branched-chain amino acid transport system substrate-binding protein
MKMGKKFKFITVCLSVLFLTALIFAGLLTPDVHAQNKPIKVGFSMALSGGMAAAGKAALMSMQICVEDFNAKGGVLGRPVELVYYDDHSKPADVPGIYTKLISVDKVDFVVGPYATAMIAPSMPIVMQQKMVFISLYGLGINSKFHYPYKFDIMPAGPHPYTDWSKGFFEVASEQTPKPKTVALLAVDNEYGVNGQSGADENAKAYGMKVVYKERMPPGTTDCTPLMRAIKAKNPDIVWMSTYAPETVCTLRAAKEVDLVPKMIGGGLVGAQFTSIQTSLGPDLNNVIFYHTWAPAPTLKFKGIDAFLKKYQAQAVKEGVDPLGYYLPPYAYAYVQILFQAIEATKSMDQKTVGEFMRKNEFDTVVGKVKFDAQGEWVKSRMLQVQVQGVKSHDVSEFAKPGTFAVLYPTEWAYGKIVYPFPGWK